jgi:hypothetical protein
MSGDLVPEIGPVGSRLNYSLIPSLVTAEMSMAAEAFFYEDIEKLHAFVWAF